MYHQEYGASCNRYHYIKVLAMMNQCFFLAFAKMTIPYYGLSFLGWNRACRSMEAWRWSDYVWDKAFQLKEHCLMVFNSNFLFETGFD